MYHVVLLGDSIFDNARYVPDGPPVIEQVRRVLPAGWLATLLAVDGHVTCDVSRQLKNLPTSASHLVVSVGGNDALRASAILGAKANSVSDALRLMYDVRTRFRQTYRAMLQALAAVSKPAAVCTVYDSVPGLEPAEQVALAGYNEIILHEAFEFTLPVIDLRLVCTKQADYSSLSPIEPSMQGGAKIAKVIAELLTIHDFGSRRGAIYI